MKQRMKFDFIAFHPYNDRMSELAGLLPSMDEALDAIREDYDQINDDCQAEKDRLDPYGRRSRFHPTPDLYTVYEVRGVSEVDVEVNEDGSFVQPSLYELYMGIEDEDVEEVPHWFTLVEDAKTHEMKLKELKSDSDYLYDEDYVDDEKCERDYCL